jgi:hypothetical protein
VPAASFLPLCIGICGKFPWRYLHIRESCAILHSSNKPNRRHPNNITRLSIPDKFTSPGRNSLTSVATSLLTLLLPHSLLFLIRMRFEGLSSLALFGLAASHAIENRAPAEAAVAVAADDDDRGRNWHPHTKEPHFFNLRINDRCDAFASPTPETQKSQCPFDSYAVRLEKGILVATPYNKWYDPKLPTFFVDDDTCLYTVSQALPNECLKLPLTHPRTGQQGTPSTLR